MNRKEEIVDLVIIGAGVSGAAVAQRMARYDLETVLVEREHDVAMGTSGANSGIIHAGYASEPNTLKGRLCPRGNSRFSRLCSALKVPFRQTGSLVVGFDRGELKVLKELKNRGHRRGIAGLAIIGGDDLHRLEPRLNPEARFALYAPTAGLVDPCRLTIGLIENAIRNGTSVMLGTEVTGFEVAGGRVQAVITDQGRIRTRLVVNASGLYADRIAELVGGESFSITPRRGEYHLLDTSQGGLVRHTLFPTPSQKSKGILVTPTVHGNLLLGPNAQEVGRKDDVSTTPGGLKEIERGARELVPGVETGNVIRSFSGLRAAADGEDFIIRPDRRVSGIIHVAGIQSPGLTSAPSVAERVEGLIGEMAAELSGLTLEPREDFKAENPGYPRGCELSPAVWRKLVSSDPDYGEIVCRCEQVTRGEVLAALRPPLAATSVDGVKRRTRAGMGRCQGGFCTPRIIEIAAEELGISPLKVTKKGPGSNILLKRTKDLLLSSGDGGEGHA